MSAYALLAMVSTLFISILLENGVFLIEIGQVSYSIDLPVKATIQLSSFLLGAFLLFSFLSRSSLRVINLNESLNQIIIWSCRSLVIIIISILYLIAIKYGTPISHGLHRNDYWTFVAPSWGAALVYFLIQFNFILGLNYSKIKSKIDVFLYGTVILTIILMGERFTGILYSFFFFFIPILVNNTKINIKISAFKKTVFLICALFILGITVLKSFSAIDQNTNPVENVVMRAALQPQMWWALDEQSGAYPRDLGTIFDRYYGFFVSDRVSGTYYLMDQVTSKSLVDARYETKSKFTMSGFFNNVYFFGYFLGALINFLWGLFFGLLCYFLLLGIQCRNILFSFISFKFLYKIQAILLVGSIPDVFSIGTLAFMLICIFFLRLT
ncbi:hypothetical protein C3F34_06370 [Acinetobacter sp. ACNIH2]|uniref:DUF6418 domain-containing protein n=1 Tax=Acinetobacter sp. ACNIH2 TaxID=1758189 RepID=UPI000CDBCDEE|nr:DUF6418 domain-containing protein [Acinetobacter sp. ACNIH2]AUX85726.1 hypothetical protein C3F34_06370 [Acinetobacter sp. ACNIH2]